MGWLNEGSPGHEGYVIGVVPTNHRYRELSLEDEKREHVVLAEVQVGCDCGWRSARLMAPSGTFWSPFIVTLPSEAHEYSARLLWRTHLAMTAKRDALIVPFPTDVYGKPRDPRCMCVDGASSMGHDVRCPAYQSVGVVRHRRDPVSGRTFCCNLPMAQLPPNDELTDIPERVNCQVIARAQAGVWRKK